MARTDIEWTDYSWNPVTGCSLVSEGCEHCYARRVAWRLRGRFGYPHDDPFRVMVRPDKLRAPMRWKKPRKIFVCSMGDLFHPDVPGEVVRDIYDVMQAAKQHTFIVVTKRPERIEHTLYGEPNYYFGGGDYLPNVWHLATVENQERADERIPHLLKFKEAGCGAWKIGVSVEPMLGPVRIGVTGTRLDWVICGGETGPGAREMKPEWALDLLSQCQDAGIPFFFKRMGGGRETPHDLQVREWPEG